MLDFTAFRATKASLEQDTQMIPSHMTFTYIPRANEESLYQDLNAKLTAIEVSTNYDLSSVLPILEQTKKLVVCQEDKQDLLIRIGWLKKLHTINTKLDTLSSREDIQVVRAELNSIQTCPLKNEILSKLDSLEEDFPIEAIPYLVSQEERMMEQAIDEAGDVFINLGKVGREHVITKIAEDGFSIEKVSQYAKNLEDQVETLKQVSDTKSFIEAMKQLPLESYSSLNNEQVESVAKDLIGQRNWLGLASLDQTISRLIAVILTEEENPNTIVTLTGKATPTLTSELLEKR